MPFMLRYFLCNFYSFFCSSLFLLCLNTPLAFAHAEHNNSTASQLLTKEEQVAQPKMEEHLGEYIPKGIILKNEEGEPIDPTTLMDIPTVIVPVYFSCPGACNTLQSSMAATIPNVTLVPGKEFRVITISFDEEDSSEAAKRKKQNFLAATDFTFPENEWRFLTGDKKNIKKFMDALGFPFIKKGPGDFLHPVGIIVTAPGGKISRYMYGQGFMPFDITMACTEAMEGKTGLSIKRVLSYCFAYDPESRGYVFNFMRVIGVIVLFGMAVFFFVLTRKKKS